MWSERWVRVSRQSEWGRVEDGNSPVDRRSAKAKALWQTEYGTPRTETQCGWSTEMSSDQVGTEDEGLPTHLQMGPHTHEHTHTAQ